MSSQSSWIASFVKNNGDLYLSGYNYYGNVGTMTNGRTGNPTAPTKVNLANVKQVAAGYYHTMVVTTDGKLYGMGYNYYGQLGIATNWRSDASLYTPTLVMTDVKEVACGYLHTVVLKNNGEVWTFGYNAYGQLGNGNWSDTYVPQKVFTNAKKIGAGYTHSMVIDNTTKLWTCGYNGYGGLGISDSNNHATFKDTGITGVRSVDGGIYYTIFVKNDGNAYGMGRNYHGNLGISLNWRSNNFMHTPQFIANNVKQVACGGYHSAVLKTNGDLYTFGENSRYQLGNGNNTDTYTQTKVRTNVRAVAMGYYHTTVLDNDGKVYGVGRNDYFQTGVSTTTGNITVFTYTGISDVRSLMGTITSNINLQGGLVAANIHKQDAVVQVAVDHVDKAYVKYRILVNGVQKFPTSGWTADQPTAYSITKNLPHTYFNLGQNFILLEATDANGDINSIGMYLTKDNAAPVINATANLSAVHKQNVRVDAMLDDLDGDRVQYKVFLNNVQKYPSVGYSELMLVPVNIGFTFNNADLKIGANTIKIELVDDLGVASTKTITIIKTNASPTVTGQVLGAFVDAKVNDADGDKCRYLIKINGTQIYPATGYTEPQPVPFDIKYTIPKQYILLGQNNKVRIEVLDELNGTQAWEFTFTGQYSGLMFCDATETFYSTDFGDILRYLDFGTIVAGQTTAAERVWVKNTLGYPVDNIQITLDQRELDGVEAKAEISQFDAPFQPENVLVYNGTFNHNDKISFYVRVVTTRNARVGGMFDIKVKADPK